MNYFIVIGIVVIAFLLFVQTIFLEEISKSLKFYIRQQPLSGSNAEASSSKCPADTSDSGKRYTKACRS